MRDTLNFTNKTTKCFERCFIHFVTPNPCAALVGHSGSGKSTVVQLLERYYDVNDGEILLDGKNIKEYNPRWIHRKVGLVSQEPVLFSCSIKENITYGVLNASDEAIGQVAEIANAKRFIDKLPEKYNTIVGERGTQLSGGQRQIIAIARAVIKNPRILITDEATSSFDAKSERKVQEALDKVMAGRTAIIVAHRLSTIKNADVIYCFEDGTIIEYGTHKELLEKQGAYFKLVEKQLGKEALRKAALRAAQNQSTTSENSESEKVDSKSKEEEPKLIDVKTQDKHEEDKKENQMLEHKSSENSSDNEDLSSLSSSSDGNKDDLSSLSSDSENKEQTNNE